MDIFEELEVIVGIESEIKKRERTEGLNSELIQIKEEIQERKKEVLQIINLTSDFC